MPSLVKHVILMEHSVPNILWIRPDKHFIKFFTFILEFKIAGWRTDLLLNAEYHKILSIYCSTKVSLFFCVWRTYHIFI